MRTNAVTVKKECCNFDSMAGKAKPVTGCKCQKNRASGGMRDWHPQKIRLFRDSLCRKTNTKEKRAGQKKIEQNPFAGGALHFSCARASKQHGYHKNRCPNAGASLSFTQCEWPEPCALRCICRQEQKEMPGTGCTTDDGLPVMHRSGLLCQRSQSQVSVRLFFACARDFVYGFCFP